MHEKGEKLKGMLFELLSDYFKNTQDLLAKAESPEKKQEILAEATRGFSWALKDSPLG